MCVPTFNIVRLIVPEKSATKNEIKRLINRNSLILVYTIQTPTVHVYTKFQLCRPYSSWEKCDEKFSQKRLHTHTNIFTEKAKTIYPLYTLYTGGINLLKTIYPLYTLYTRGIRQKEKWTNKGNDKQEEADSLLHNKTFVPNFKILGSVVPEKSFTKKKFTQTHIVTEKTKTTYPLYTVVPRYNDHLYNGNFDFRRNFFGNGSYLINLWKFTIL